MHDSFFTRSVSPLAWMQSLHGDVCSDNYALFKILDSAYLGRTYVDWETGNSENEITDMPSWIYLASCV